MCVEYSKNVLIQGKNKYEFNYDIKKVLNIGMKAIVLLKFPFDQNKEVRLSDEPVYKNNANGHDDNIFCIEGGRLLWRIEDINIHFKDIIDSSKHKYGSYSDIALYKNNLYIIDYRNYTFKVNIEDGSIVGKLFQDNDLYVDEKILHFSYMIYQCQIREDTIYVVQDPFKYVINDFKYDECRLNSNIWAIRDGKVIWKVQDYRKKYPMLPDTTFAGIHMRENYLRAVNYNGQAYSVNFDTGEIMERLDWTK